MLRAALALALTLLAGAARAEDLHPLAPLYEEMARIDAGDPRRIRILQLGDSHTAGDVLTGRLRQLFQAEYGSAGRGLLPPGLPYGQLPHGDVRIRTTGRWTYSGGLQPSASGIYGISGFIARSRGRDAAVNVESLDAEGFDRGMVEVLRHPGGGRLAIRVDGKTVREVATAAATPTPELVRFSAPPRSRKLDVVALDAAPVELMSLAVERGGAGVVFDSLGISGATVGVMARWDADLVKQELAARRPTLVILAFGTNEGFQDDTDPARYAALFAEQIRRVRKDAPGAAILVVGPPDADRLPAGCAPSAAGACVIDPDRARRCEWYPPRALATVREVQRRVAAEEGAFFWDWSAVMGGRCGAHRWFEEDPPRERRDHIHMTTAGYGASAEALYRAIVEGYRAWQGSPHIRPKR